MKACPGPRSGIASRVVTPAKAGVQGWGNVARGLVPRHRRVAGSTALPCPAPARAPPRSALAAAVLVRTVLVRAIFVGTVLVGAVLIWAVLVRILSLTGT